MYGIYIEWNLCDAVNQVVETMHLPFPDPHSFVSTISFNHSFFRFKLDEGHDAGARPNQWSWGWEPLPSMNAELETAGGQGALLWAVAKTAEGPGPQSERLRQNDAKGHSPQRPFNERMRTL